MDNINYLQTKITGGIWKQKQNLVREVTADAVYNRFKDTGRIDAFKFRYKEGDKDMPHFFWDSDVAKWIEGVAYITGKKKNRRLERMADAIIKDIEKNQGEDGYFNIHFTVVEPNGRFSKRDHHELYCLGHLLEAGIAYFEATGKRKLLDCMIKYVDYVIDRFMVKKDVPFKTPGHEEIEMALVRLYELTGEKKHLDLAKYFIDNRGVEYEHLTDWAKAEYSQSHKPVREQDEAIGHAVRATYLYSGMADLAYVSKDKELEESCKKLFDDLTTKKMYITGGIGSSNGGEAITVAYDLPNLLAYTESCASIGLVLFANKMQRMDLDSKYADIIERTIYNGFLSTISLDGKSFFYENPNETIPYLATRDKSVTWPSINWPQRQRSEIFGCSCCPPNIVRFIPSIANLIYSTDNKNLYVHQFMESESKMTINGKNIIVKQKTKYPENGKIKISVSGGDIRMGVRIPWWVENSKYNTEKGYAYFDVKDGETIEFNFEMKPTFIEARPEVYFDCNRFAVMRGPVVYCLESKDNGAYLRDIILDSKKKMKYTVHPELNVPMLIAKAYRRKVDKDTPLYSPKKDNYIEIEAKLIPYYAFANRGENEMQIWTYIK